VCRSKHFEQLRNTGIINSTTRSHLVGYFYTIYIMMHGSMNILLKHAIIQIKTLFVIVILKFVIKKRLKFVICLTADFYGAQKYQSIHTEIQLAMYCTYVSNNVYPWIGFHMILFRKCHFIYFPSVANWNCFLWSEFEGRHYETQSCKPYDIGRSSNRMAAINKTELFQLIPVVLFLALNKFKFFILFLLLLFKVHHNSESYFKSAIVLVLELRFFAERITFFGEM